MNGSRVTYVQLSASMSNEEDRKATLPKVPSKPAGVDV